MHFVTKAMPINRIFYVTKLVVLYYYVKLMQTASMHLEFASMRIKKVLSHTVYITLSTDMMATSRNE